VEESFKHSIIIPKHHVINLIIEEEHKMAKHVGWLLTLNIIRRKYWIIGVKAAHLELVSSLETKSFLAALTRFLLRRGACSEIYSDNGNKQIYTTIAEKLANEKIKWHFILPATSYFGGLWEAAMKSVKKLLRTTLAEKALTFEEFYTVLVEVEACLNQCAKIFV
jgi:hypothetical protein